MPVAVLEALAAAAGADIVAAHPGEIHHGRTAKRRPGRGRGRRSLNRLGRRLHGLGNGLRFLGWHGASSYPALPSVTLLELLAAAAPAGIVATQLFAAGRYPGRRVAVGRLRAGRWASGR